MSSRKRNPRGVAIAAELSISEDDWETTENAALQLLAIARKEQAKPGGDE